jgi:TolB-like protein/class 3 adenylate cyclase
VAETPSRKLAVILHADVVGSTNLVQRDETLAHTRIQDVFHRFSETIELYGGATTELRGDALVAEFSRASDAVCTAVAFQAENGKFNDTIEDDIRPQLRVGVAMGEVVIADNTVTGPGVVLAQRLEQLAEPGGVCIHDAAYETVPKRLPFDYESLGEQEVKGFTEPVRAHAVGLKPGETIPGPESRAETVEAVIEKPVWRRVVGGVIVLLILAGGGLAWWQPWKPAFEPASMERMALALPDKPSIAVLPFTNMSGDAEQEYFVDGMTEDLITDLSKLSGLFVIARSSTFTYKGKSVKVRQVAEELGVRYVLEGSVRRAGDQVRINAQLIDATTGGHLWAERYDGSLADVFALQDKVTQKIVSALAISLTDDEKTRSSQKETSSPDAYDAFLEGRARYRFYTRDDFIKAIPHFERALELDPDYGRAHAALAAVYSESWWNGWIIAGVAYQGNIRRAGEHLREAMKDPTPVAHRVASFWHIVNNQFDEAMGEAQRAIDLDPNDPNGYEAMARVLVHLGRPAESLNFINRATRLNPRSDYLYRLGEAKFHQGQYEEAATTMLKYSKSHPNNFYPFLYMAAAYGHLGRKQEAISAVETYKKIRTSVDFPSPGGALEQVAIYFFKKGGIEEERLREGLRKAGFDAPPEVVEASSERITLKKPVDGAIGRVYEAANKHCRKHGKKSYIVNSSPPSYVFGCQ